MTGCHTEKSRDTPCHSTYAGVSYDTVGAAAAIEGYSGYSSPGVLCEHYPVVKDRCDERQDHGAADKPLTEGQASVTSVSYHHLTLPTR